MSHVCRYSRRFFEVSMQAMSALQPHKMKRAQITRSNAELKEAERIVRNVQYAVRDDGERQLKNFKARKLAFEDKVKQLRQDIELQEEQLKDGNLFHIGSTVKCSQGYSLSIHF